MSWEEFINFELSMLPAFQRLILKYGRKIYSLTPNFGDNGENPNLIPDEEYKALVDAHVMINDMSADPFLKTAGISDDWPYGRGCSQSEDKMRIIWFKEVVQLRIMCKKNGDNLLEVFTNFKEMLDTVQGIEGIEFVKDENDGYITSCPNHLGTAMRASVIINIPKLTSDGTGKIAKEVNKPLGLSISGPDENIPRFLTIVLLTSLRRQGCSQKKAKSLVTFTMVSNS